MGSVNSCCVRSLFVFFGRVTSAVPTRSTVPVSVSAPAVNELLLPEVVPVQGCCDTSMSDGNHCDEP